MDLVGVVETDLVGAVDADLVLSVVFLTGIGAG